MTGGGAFEPTAFQDGAAEVVEIGLILIITDDELLSPYEENK